MERRLIFGGSGIMEALYRYIRQTLPEGSVILELGSGDVSTNYLCRDYRLFSVEDKAEWLGKYPRATYIPACLVDNWYDPLVLANFLPKDYQLILVDGPTGEGNRGGFLRHLNLFNTGVPIIFDDTNRVAEFDLATAVARVLKRPIQWFDTFAVI